VTTQAVHYDAHQLAELTRGHSLPLPPLPAPVVDLIGRSIVRALSELFPLHTVVFAAGGERDINQLVISRLNALRDSDPRIAQVMLAAVGDAGRLSYAGVLDKRPDIQIILTNGRPANFPLLIECKLISTRPRRTVSMYAGFDGLQRMVDGRYGWEMAEVLMLAYVRNGKSIGALQRLLRKWSRGVTKGQADPAATIQHPGQPNGWGCSQSLHARTFAYQHAAGAPGPVSVWHVWWPIP
jgi:hypothetical protein